MRTHLLFLAICSSIACAQSSRTTGPDFAAIRQQLLAHVGKDDVPGLTIAVAKSGQILWKEGFGWADREKQLPATPETPFYIASISKTMTATAVLHLAALGKLQLNDPVNKYLDRAKVHSPRWNASDATILRVMTHTSGLTTFTRWCDTAADPRCHIDHEIEQYGILVWPPGDVFDYSNLGYGILGQLVARVASQSFDSYLRNTIFRPLHMRGCGVSLDSASDTPAAARYDEKTHARTPPRVSGHDGASGLYCSAQDLLAFGRFHLKENLSQDSPLNAAEIDQMHAAQPGTDGKYGLGWWIRERAGVEIISAQGGTTDSYALLELIPAKDIAIVILANSYSPMVGGLETQVLSVLLPGLPDDSMQRIQPAERILPVSHALTGKWTGQILTAEGRVPVTLEISRDGGARSHLAQGPGTTLTQVSLAARHFYGELSGQPGLPDSFDHPFTIALDLGLYGDELVGAATFGPLPGNDGDQLPHFVTLARAKP